MAYVLLTGFTPFGGDTDQETFQNICHGQLDFPDELFEDISPQAEDFIRKTLSREPRYSEIILFRCIAIEKYALALRYSLDLFSIEKKKII